MPVQVNSIAYAGIVDLLLNVNIARKVGNFWRKSGGLKKEGEERELLQTIDSSMSEIDGGDTEDEDKELWSQIAKMGMNVVKGTVSNRQRGSWLLFYDKKDVIKDKTQRF